MKQVFLFCILSLLCMLPFATAANISAGQVIPVAISATIPSELSHCEQLFQDYRIQGITLSERMPFNDEVIHVYVEDEAYASITLVNKKVQQASCALEGEATITATLVSQNIIRNILESEDTVQAYLDAKNANQIILQGETLNSRTKLFFANIGIRLYKLFR